MFGSMVPSRRRDVSNLPETMLGDIRKEMDRLFEGFLGEPWSIPSILGGQFAPAFDISETENELVVKAELPGVDPQDVDISLTGNVLTIKGEKREEHETQGETMHRLERVFGSFSRSFTLPCEVREDQIQATYKDGLLDLRLPKSESSKTRKIKIQVH